MLSREPRLPRVLFGLTHACLAFLGVGPRNALGQDERTHAASNTEIVTPASSPASRAFGDSGVTVVSGNVSVSNLNFSNSDATQFSFVAEPGLDYFIGPSVSVGGYVLLSYSHQKGYDYFGPLIESEEIGMD